MRMSDTMGARRPERTGRMGKVLRGWRLALLPALAVLTIAVSVATLTAEMTSPAPAEARPAHRYAQSVATAVAENAYRSHCGNGTLWFCNGFPTWEFASPVGDHSWKVDLQWSEIHIANPRSCAVSVRVEHDFIAQTYTAEHCWG